MCRVGVSWTLSKLVIALCELGVGWQLHARPAVQGCPLALDGPRYCRVWNWADRPNVHHWGGVRGPVWVREGISLIGREKGFRMVPYGISISILLDKWTE